VKYLSRCENLSRTEAIDLAAKYDGGHLQARYLYRVSHNRFFLTIFAAASRQNGGFYVRFRYFKISYFALLRSIG
jgi:hypothetical protein